MPSMITNRHGHQSHYNEENQELILLGGI